MWTVKEGSWIKGHEKIMEELINRHPLNDNQSYLDAVVNDSWLQTSTRCSEQKNRDFAFPLSEGFHSSCEKKLQTVEVLKEAYRTWETLPVLLSRGVELRGDHWSQPQSYCSIIHRRIRLPEAEWHVCPCLRDGLNEENTFRCMSRTGLCVTNSDSSSYE